MKTKFNYFLMACLVTGLSIGSSFAQVRITKSSTATRFEYGDKSATPSNDGSVAASGVSARALTAFSKSYPGASDAKWSQVGKKYAVDFTKDEKQHKSLFDQKGHLIYSLSFGSEKDLPRDIRRMVKREYIDYNITQAVEAKEDNRDVWIINLDDADSFVSVGVENGSMAELSHYKKLKN